MTQLKIRPLKQLMTKRIKERIVEEPLRIQEKLIVVNFLSKTNTILLIFPSKLPGCSKEAFSSRQQVSNDSHQFSSKNYTTKTVLLLFYLVVVVVVGLKRTKLNLNPSYTLRHEKKKNHFLLSQLSRFHQFAIILC